MSFALSNRTQQIGLVALIAGIGFLALGISRHLVLFAFMICVLASTRFAWTQIRTRGSERPESLFAAIFVPMIVSAIAVAIVLWEFENLVRGR